LAKFPALRFALAKLRGIYITFAHKQTVVRGMATVSFANILIFTRKVLLSSSVQFDMFVFWSRCEKEKRRELLNLHILNSLF